jgi:hypothetical protein
MMALETLYGGKEGVEVAEMGVKGRGGLSRLPCLILTQWWKGIWEEESLSSLLASGGIRAVRITNRADSVCPGISMGR